MNLPNKLTMLRIILIPVFLVLVLVESIPIHYLWALLVYLIACFTDTLDGHIARSRGLVTDFGKLMDPLADKLLVTACLMVFVGQGRMASWIAFIVVAREFAIMGLRSIAAAHGRVIAAGWSGKIKTSCTMVGLIAMMIFPSVQILDTVVCAVILVTTLYSGFEYFQKNWDVLMPGA